MRKLLSIFVIMMIIMSLFIGCAKDVDSEQHTIGDEKPQEPIVLVSAEPTDSLDPLGSINVATDDYTYNVFSSLTQLDKGGKGIPLLAKSWEIDDEGLTTTFYLRDDVYFHDDSKLTADDVKYSIDTLLSDEVRSVQASQYITSIEVIDEYTVKIVQPNYMVDLPQVISFFPIVPKAVREKDIEAFGKASIGSGPYKFVSVESDGTIKLAANENYFLGKPEIKEVVLRPAMDIETAIIALEAGEVDIIRNIPGISYDMLEAHESITVQNGSYTAASTMLMSGITIQDDINLKKAIYHLIDREKALLLSEISYGEPARNLFGISVMRDLGDIVTFNDYDLEKAKEYFDKSSYNKEEPLEIVIVGDATSLAQSLQADFEAIGLELEIKMSDPSAYIQTLFYGEWDLAILTFDADPGTNLLSMLATLNLLEQAFQFPEEWNEALAAIEETKEKENRDELLINAMQFVHDNAYLTPIYESYYNIAFNSDKIKSLSPLAGDAFAIRFDLLKLK